MNLADVFTDEEISAALSKWDIGNHHPLGPSSIYRVRNCMASAVGNLVCCQEESNPYAERGTRIHKAIEEYIRHGVEPDSDSEEAEHLERAKMALGMAPRLWMSERRMEMPGLYFGTADAVRIYSDRWIAYILDWKTGAASEASKESHKDQMIHLAYALLSEYPMKEVVASCVYTDMNEMSEAVEVYPDGLEEYRQRISNLKRLCQSPLADFSTDTGPFCKYCRVRSAGRCPTANAEQKEAESFLGVTVPDAQELSQVEQADELLVKCNTVLHAVEAMADKAKQVIKTAGGSDHFFVYSSKPRTTTDWKAIAYAVAVAGDIPEELIRKHSKTGEPSLSIKERTSK